MSKPRVYITRRIASKAIRLLEDHAELTIWEGDDPPDHQTICENVKQSTGLISLLTDPIDQGVMLAGQPNLKIISQMAVGFDNIDIRAATELGLPVGHTPGVLTETCADFTIALMLGIARRITESSIEVQNGIWRTWGPEVLIGDELYGKNVGLLGFGRIGQAVAKRLSGFDVKICYHDVNRKPDAEKEFNAEYCDFDDLLKLSDYVSIHTALNNETSKLFNKTVFSKMKNTAYLINTARGGIVHSDDLYDAIVNKEIAGAALDVFDPEPIQFDHPILSMKNVLVTPHIASASKKTREKMAMIAAENMIAGLNHLKMPYCANPQVYEKL